MHGGIESLCGDPAPVRALLHELCSSLRRSHQDEKGKEARHACHCRRYRCASSPTHQSPARHGSRSQGTRNGDVTEDFVTVL
eukprot:763026-Hanusia_phi.AAC.11